MHGKKCFELLNGQAEQNGASFPFEFLKSLQAAGFRNHVSSWEEEERLPEDIVY